MNECMFIGNLGADPEIKSFSNGNRIANLKLAVSERWKDKSTGEQKEKTEWIPVTINSDGLVGVVERFLHKGSKILIRGTWRTRKWTDQNGNDRYSTECVVSGFDGKLLMLDKPEGGRGNGGPSAKREQAGFDDGLDDGSDIPF